MIYDKNKEEKVERLFNQIIIRLKKIAIMLENSEMFNNMKLLIIITTLTILISCNKVITNSTTTSLGKNIEVIKYDSTTTSTTSTIVEKVIKKPKRNKNLRKHKENIIRIPLEKYESIEELESNSSYIEEDIRKYHIDDTKEEEVNNDIIVYNSKSKFFEGIKRKVKE